MKLLLTFIGWVMYLTSFGQKPDQIIIASIEHTDRTFHKRHELFLENHVTKNQVVYTLDSASQSYTADKYLVETYFNVWDGDTIVEERLKTRYKRWSNCIDSLSSQELVSALKSDVDTLEKYMCVVHTSHHYLTIYLDVVFGNDTMKYYKTKPFEYLTPWFSKRDESTLNPNLDRQLFMILPDKFIGRERLNLAPAKP